VSSLQNISDQSKTAIAEIEAIFDAVKHAQSVTPLAGCPNPRWRAGNTNSLPNELYIDIIDCLNCLRAGLEKNVIKDQPED